MTFDYNIARKFDSIADAAHNELIRQGWMKGEYKTGEFGEGGSVNGRSMASIVLAAAAKTDLITIDEKLSDQHVWNTEVVKNYIMDKPSLGQIAFEAYCEVVNGVAHDGKPIPPWHELTPTIRLAWDAAASAVYKQHPSKPMTN